MTVAEYMDPNRFPHTTQPGLTPHDQLLIDATNYDAVVEAEANGRTFTAEEEATAAELRVKHTARAEVAVALRSAGA